MSNTVLPTSYESAKKLQLLLDQALTAASKDINKFPRGPMGLTPDHVKATTEWKNCNKRFLSAFSAFRKINQYITKTFKKEEKERRDAEAAAREARFRPEHNTNA